MFKISEKAPTISPGPWWSAYSRQAPQSVESSLKIATSPQESLLVLIIYVRIQFSKSGEGVDATVTEGFAYAYDPYEFFASAPKKSSTLTMADPEHGRGLLFAYLDRVPRFQQTQYDVPYGSFPDETIKLAQLPETFAQPFNPLPIVKELARQNHILWNQEIVEKRDLGALHYKNSDDSITAIFGIGVRNWCQVPFFFNYPMIQNYHGTSTTSRCRERGLSCDQPRQRPSNHLS